MHSPRPDSEQCSSVISCEFAIQVCRVGSLSVGFTSGSWRVSSPHVARRCERAAAARVRIVITKYRRQGAHGSVIKRKKRRNPGQGLARRFQSRRCAISDPCRVPVSALAHDSRRGRGAHGRRDWQIGLWDFGAEEGWPDALEARRCDCSREAVVFASARVSMSASEDNGAVPRAGTW